MTDVSTTIARLLSASQLDLKEWRYREGLEPVALAAVRLGDRLGEDQRERLQAAAAGVVGLEERLGVREHRQEVDDVVLRVFVDVQVLVPERPVKRIAEELAHVRDGLELHGVSWLQSSAGIRGVRRSFA